MKLEKLEPLDSPNYLRLIFEDGKRLKAPAFKVVELGLTPGVEVTPEVFLALENAQSLASCKERAVRILTASGLSKKELQKRLVQKGESEEDAEAAVAWLEELHLIDDLETAKQLVRSACLRGYGAARAKSILYEKGIPKELWDEALEDLPEMDGAIDVFLRRKLDGRTLDAKQIKKTVDALLRRGHSYHDIQAGLRRYEASLSLEQTQEDTWEDME
ncbi:MAG TPA: RecX family transcriptional regulator [Clostridiales bacterium]|nr:RecX family transcriptional regulator [Clostridiales bacterium]